MMCMRCDPTGRFSAVLLNIDLQPHLIDVNIHPKKRRTFLHAEQLFKVLPQTLRTALSVTSGLSFQSNVKKSFYKKTSGYI